MWIFRRSQKGFAALTIKSLTLALSVLAVAGCGVKGDPIPPERPAEIGTGRPQVGSGGNFDYKPAAIPKNSVDEESKTEDQNSEENVQ